MQRTTFCIKVPKEQGENAISLMSQLGVLDKSLEIQRDEHNLHVPLIRQLEGNELATLKSQMSEYQFETEVFTQKQPTATTLTQALETRLPPPLLTSLPKGFDIVGDIAIIEIPLELKPFEKIIGEAILRTHKNIKTVLAKAGSISGTFRLRALNFIGGEHKTQTVHREFGCQYHVDLAKAYFSPRLSHELIRWGRTILSVNRKKESERSGFCC
jgi:tRNA (guanine37-N1)-methyltransferase